MEGRGMRVFAWVVVVVAVGLIVVLLVGWLPTDPEKMVRSGASARVEPSPTRQAGEEPAECGTEQVSKASALAVVRGWDRRRTAAWASGESRAVAELYRAGSRAGRADVAALKRWQQRGWRIERVGRQLAELRVRTCRSEAIEVEIAGRLVGAVAVRTGRPSAPTSGPPSHERVPLPAGQLRQQVVAWQYTGETWQLASARPVR